MSETAPEASRSSGGGKITQTFTTRIGPLPMWVWLVIVAGILIAWRVYSSKSQAASSADQAGTDTGVPADQVPQFVNQTYTTTTPPQVNITTQPQVRVFPPIPGPPGPPGPASANVVVPDVHGLPAAAAFQVLRSQALDPGPGGISPKRIVLKTSPPAGSRVAKHTKITVTVK